MGKGQASTEFLVILAVALVIFLAIVTISQDQLTKINIIKSQKTAQATVDTIAAAADDVYSQGVGARKRVFVEFPVGYSSTNSFVKNRTINLNFLGSDVAVSTNFDVYGSLPASSGSTWVWVISEGNIVRIGNVSLLLSRSSISTTLSRNTTKNETFYVQNGGNGSMTVTISQNWLSTNVILVTTPFSFTLDSGQSQLVTLTFTADNDAVGVYNGSLDVVGSSGGTNETVNLPVAANVVIGGTQVPKLTITPSTWNDSLLQNQSVLKAFNLCTNSQTSLSYVNFTATGSTSAWLSNLNALGALAANTCQIAVFNLTIPSNTFSGNYSGTITATGSDTSATDNVVMQINVGGNLTDILGPLVTNITITPTKPFYQEPLTFRITGDDSQRGNNTIVSFETNLDNGTWFIMNPVDGAYSSSVENASYTYASPSFGMHTAYFRCTDFRSNVGPTASYGFKIMKEILMVTKDNGLGGGEQDWRDWITSHTSGLGYIWNFDAIDRNTVNGGGTDTSLYSTILIADDVTTGGAGASLVPILINYASSGGYVVIVDKGAEKSPHNLGLAKQDADDEDETTIYVVSNAHYITSGYTVNSDLQIYTVSSNRYLQRGFSGFKLANDQSGNTDNALGYSGNYVIWGATKPYRFVTDGNTISTRVFDYAINGSTK